MSLNLSYIFSSKEQKRDVLIPYALQDSFFAPIVHDFIDYGYEISFCLFGGAGAYQPFALASEPLDTPEKQEQFARGFWCHSEEGRFKAKIKLSLWLGQAGNIHSFLHELMHFYQDTLGLYLLPLKEQGVVPVMADLRSSVLVFLFCEAWAEVEAIRTCWSLNHKGLDSRGWLGALGSPDWGALARFYDGLLQEGADEAVSAARTFERWYDMPQRRYYERQATGIYEREFLRLTCDVDKDKITDHLRCVKFSDLLLRIPQEHRPRYFEQVDWDLIQSQKLKFPERFSCACNDAWLDIKCASPPYLWKRLREGEIAGSQVPPG